MSLMLLKGWTYFSSVGMGGGWGGGGQMPAVLLKGC